MAAPRITRLTRRTQPQGAVGVDWSNPITRGLTFVYTPAMGGAAIVHGVYRLASTTYAACPRGPTVDGIGDIGDDNGRLLWTALPSVVPNPDWSIFARYSRFVSAMYAASSPLYCGDAWTWRGPDISAYFSTPNRLYISSSGQYVNETSAATNRPTSFCRSIASGVSGGALARIAGQWAATATVTFAGRSTPHSVSVGMDPYDAAKRSQTGTSLSISAAWSRALSADEILSLEDNPWQLFAPLERRIWLPAASGGLPTLSAATYMPGSLTSSGFRPRVTAS